MKKSIIILLAAAAVSCNEPKTYPAAWSPAGDRIKTQWAEQVDPLNVLPEYPRPQMVRSEWLSMNGLWNYAVADKEAGQPEEWDGQILVPFAIESSLSGVGKAVPDSCALWYRTTFKVPRQWKGLTRINFDAVDFQAEVYVNGNLAGSHTGGYAPFSIDATPFLKNCGTQELVVKVTDQTDGWFQARGKQVRKPSGIWYTSVTGIWQSVWLEPVNESHITAVSTTANIAESTFAVNIDGENIQEGDAVSIEVIDGGMCYDSTNPEGKVVAKSGITEFGEPITIKVPDASKWSPDNPYLYGIRVRLFRGDKQLDKIESYAAMREIGIVETGGFKRMALNGEPLFQYGPLDQGWWPDGLYTAPTDEALRWDIIKTKEYGFNMIRKHVKVEPSRWYWHCDREGIVVWQDMPSITDNRTNKWETHAFLTGEDSKISKEGKDNYYHEWSEIIQARKFFPCIVVWVPFNEAWGQFDTEKVAVFTKSLDPTRLVNPASGGNYYYCGDIVDVHNYPGPAIKVFDKDYVNVLGEYGGLGLVEEGHVWQPEKNWGYRKYTTRKEVTDAYIALAQELPEFVEKGVSAAVYTQTTDVEIEVNGLMTYDRKVMKLDVERVKEANQNVIRSMK